MRHPDVQPMLATLGKPPSRFADFAVEAKYDGQRGMAIIDNGEVTLLSRNGANITRTFPEITAALPAAAPTGTTILDGEIVALDHTGAPSFSRLQKRWPQNRRPSAQLLRQVPVRFFVFDALHFGGRDVTRQPYGTRRDYLAELAGGKVIQVPGSWSGVDPAVVLDASVELGLEGIVCKYLDSPYIAGRSRHWIKTPLRQRDSFVVGGWLPCAGSRREVGALLVGIPEPGGRLAFCGAVGAGLSALERRRLAAALEPIGRETSPFWAIDEAWARHARWVRPEILGDVEYREFNRGALRHPSWKGVRGDLTVAGAFAAAG